MTAVKKTPSPIPVSFEQFRKNPIAAVAFCMLLAVSYLYVDLRSGYKEQIEKSNQKIDALDLKIDRLSYALKKSDSALAAAITEIRIMNTMRKLWNTILWFLQLVCVSPLLPCHNPRQKPFQLTR